MEYDPEQDGEADPARDAVEQCLPKDDFADIEPDPNLDTTSVDEVHGEIDPVIDALLDEEDEEF